MKNESIAKARADMDEVRMLRKQLIVQENRDIAMLSQLKKEADRDYKKEMQRQRTVLMKKELEEMNAKFNKPFKVKEIKELSRKFGEGKNINQEVARLLQDKFA